MSLINGGHIKLDEEYELEALNLLHEAHSPHGHGDAPLLSSRSGTGSDFVSTNDFDDDFLEMRETDDEDCIERLVKADRFQFCVGVVIMINTVVMALEADNKDWAIWPAVDNALLLFFVIELSLRLYTYGANFFTDDKEQTWNIFDFIVVVFGVGDLWILQPMKRRSPGGAEDGGRGDRVSGLVTILRVVRILRILRLFRVFKMFHELYLLAMGLVTSCKVVGWISFLFSILVVISAIFCTTLIGHDADLFPDPDFIREYFGTVLRSMTTLFQFITLDDWSYVAGQVTCVMPGMYLFFLAYVILTSFMVLSLLTGVVTDNIVKLTQEDDDKVDDDYHERIQEFDEVVTSCFRKAAVDRRVKKAQFDELLREKDVRLQLLHQEIEIDDFDSRDLFESMDTENLKELSEHVFKDGFIRMRGSAKAKDVVKLGAAVKKITKQLCNEMPSPLPLFQQKTHDLCAACQDMSQRMHDLENKMGDFLVYMGRKD
eukprot:gnl/MRDRNA2_/MRDRNA2_104760_c0_seq1.p1 gnl/MRDRNA2_/MRDRNA2_104760_c0~~gnl/MRDRNA2_/MRDRNA2_104760_c0_seq1.p1  ORF type:complete len:487 (+),score=105.24 gnl/MRDRNA2_/MRDRNA2_104760_c0_seq1:72-1532(+)